MRNVSRRGEQKAASLPIFSPLSSPDRPTTVSNSEKGSFGRSAKEPPNRLRSRRFDSLDLEVGDRIESSARHHQRGKSEEDSISICY